MQLCAGRRFESGGRKCSLAPLSSPSRTLMHNVLKVLYCLTTVNTQIANSKDKPNTSQRSIKGNLNTLTLARPESQGRSPHVGSQVWTQQPLYKVAKRSPT
eukprot:5991678-Amphidinium_carterae.1